MSITFVERFSFWRVLRDNQENSDTNNNFQPKRLKLKIFWILKLCNSFKLEANFYIHLQALVIYQLFLKMGARKIVHYLTMLKKRNFFELSSWSSNYWGLTVYSFTKKKKKTSISSLVSSGDDRGMQVSHQSRGQVP